MQTALRGLGTLADEVGQRLAAAALLIDSDPALALAHAQEARRKAARLPDVREAVGVCAYAAGEFALARAEFRAVRRMTGRADVLPLLADAERALGAPDQAIRLAALPEVATLSREDRRELAIVVAGARRDLEQYDAALAALDLPELHAGAADDSVLRLWYAYADTLAAAGRSAEARRWFGTVAGADEGGDTDAAERLAALG